MRAKTPDEIKIMREGGKKLAQVSQFVAQKAQPGNTPRELADIAQEEVK